MKHPSRPVRSQGIPGAGRDKIQPVPPSVGSVAQGYEILVRRQVFFFPFHHLHKINFLLITFLFFRSREL